MANLRIIEVPTKKFADHEEHFRVHMEEAVQVMHSVVENSDERVVNGFRNLIEQYQSSFFLEDGLDAKLHHISILVVFNLVEDYINEVCFRENQVVPFEFDEFVKKFPNIFDQMSPKAS